MTSDFGHGEDDARSGDSVSKPPRDANDSDAESIPASSMGLPAGELTFSRVVSDASAALTVVLDRRHTGYAVLTPSAALVLADETYTVLALRDGIPTHAVAPEQAGSAALACAATPGPLRVTLHECEDPIQEPAARIAPETPARRLAGDASLAARTREAAPPAPGGETPSVPDAGDDLDAVDAFLADEDAIERIKTQAREEAARRAQEWGFEEFAGE